tara:strand:- start:3601 stop:4563 length:963 start_codon:yes stop_codon:yes gene_type:complete
VKDLYKKTWFLLFCIILVSIPRFNRNQIFFKRPQADMAIHTAMVEYYRSGNVEDILLSEDSIAANWRPMFPFIASFIPLSTITSLSILGILSIFVSVIFLKKNLQLMNISEKRIFQGIYMFIFSFPSFYYTTIGYVDPGLIMMLTLGLYFCITNRLFLFMVVIAFGVFMKEGIIILIPVLFFYLYKSNNKSLNIFLYTSLATILYFLFSFIVRENAINASESYQLFWSPSIEMIKYNLNRPNSWLSIFLVLGIPLGIILINYKSLRLLIVKNIIVVPLISGVIISLLMYSFAFVSTVADGRTLWASYPFIIPLAVLLINE